MDLYDFDETKYNGFIVGLCVLILHVIFDPYTSFLPLPSPAANKLRIKLIKSSKDLQGDNVTLLFYIRSIFD